MRDDTCQACEGTGQFWQGGSCWRCNACKGRGNILAMTDLSFGQQLAVESVKLLESNLVAEIHRRVGKPVALQAQRAIEQATAAVIQHIVSPPEAPQRIKS